MRPLYGDAHSSGQTPDILQELREAVKTPAPSYDPKGWPAATCNLVSRAADEIERLRIALGQAELRYGNLMAQSN